jgi:hypothetical protein
MAEGLNVQLAGNGDAKLIFSGPPSCLQGTIRLMNPTAEKIKLRSVSIQTDRLLGAARLPLSEIPLSARLSPGEQLNIQSTIGVDPQTPPGSYPMELNIAGRAVSAVAHVTEVVDFRIQPSEITILAGKGLVYERDFIIENAGNVPLPLGERCEAPLLDSVDLVTSMLVGLRNARKKDGEHQVESWLAEWGSIAAGTLVVTRDPIILGPGQKMAASARFELPPSLAPLRHYRASLQLYNATMAVDIYTTAKAGPNRDPDVPR